MRRTLRTLVAWSIMMAIPFHGFAAASMMFCGSHHGAQSESADSAHSAQGEEHTHANHDMGASSAAHGDESDQDVSFMGIFTCKCSACAAGCTISALPDAAMPVVTFLPSISVAVTFLSSFHAGIVPDGLERPPSQHLA